MFRGLRQEQKNQLVLELQNSVIPEVGEHWERKIEAGIPPAEVVVTGKFVDRIRLNQEAEGFATFEVIRTIALLSDDWRLAPGEDGIVHYIGVGTGRAFKLVAKLFSHSGYDIVAYDTCELGIERAREAFNEIEDGGEKDAILADVHFACDERYIRPRPNTKIVIHRVLDVLDKQEIGWETINRELRKSARTAERIGKLIPACGAEVFMIFRDPTFSPGAKWGDSTPHSLQEILSYMEKGARVGVEATELGQFYYYDHLHRAVVIRRKP